MKVGSLQKKFKSFLIVLTAVCFSSKNYIIYVYKAKGNANLSRTN